MIRLAAVPAALLSVAALAAFSTTLVAASPPITIVDDPATDYAAAFAATTGIAATCTLEPGPISATSLAFSQPDAFTAMAGRIAPCAACPSPQTLDLKTVSIRVRWLSACTAQAEVSIVGATGTAGCLVPNPTQVLCGPTLHTISSPGQVGIIHTLPIPSGCCVSGDAFVLVRFIGFQNCSASPGLTLATTACVNCDEYFTTNVSRPSLTDWCTISTNGLWWRLEADCCTVTGIGESLPSVPGLRLAVSPNPATSAAELRFDVFSETEARLEIFDLAGRRCATVVAGRFGTGPHRATWRGDFDGGGTAPPGVYRARLTSREGVLTKHLVWLPK